MKKKSDNQKLEKTNQQNTGIKAAYDDFYKTYNSLPTPPSSSAAAMENLAKDNAKTTKDIEFFQQFFKSNKELPEFIRPEELRNLLGKRPGTFCWFLKYPTFLDMVLGVSPNCKEEEKVLGEAFIEGLKLKIKTQLGRIDKEIEERNKGLQKRIAELDKLKKEKSEKIEETNKIKSEIDKGNAGIAKIEKDNGEVFAAINKIKNEIAKGNRDIAERTAELDKLKKDKSKKIEEINKITIEITKRKSDLDKIEKENSGIIEQINKIKSEITKRNAGLDEIKSEIAKIDEEIDKLNEPDKKNKQEKDDWLNLQEAINIYIDAQKLYSELLTYVLESITLNIEKLQNYSTEFIKYLSEKDPLPLYIEKEALHKIILRAPVTMSVFFEYPNFFKRLIGFSPDNTKDDDADEKWKNFHAVLTLKLKTARSHQHINPNATMPVMEQLTQSRYDDIFDLIKQNQKLLDDQIAEKMYEKNCQDFAAALNANFVAVKNFMKIHANSLGESIEKEMPGCLTAKLLKRLVMYAPAYAIKYFDNYYFMLRLLADDMKGKDLMAADVFYDLQNKFDLANFADKKMIELSLKQWEIRLRLNIAITALIREIRGFIGQPIEDESKKETNALDLSDKKVANTVIEKMIRISAGAISPIQYQWIEQLTVLMEKFPKSLANNLVKEINIYLSEKSLLEEIRTKAQSLQQKNAPVVSVEPEEHVSPGLRP